MRPESIARFAKYCVRKTEDRVGQAELRPARSAGNLPSAGWLFLCCAGTFTGHSRLDVDAVLQVRRSCDRRKLARESTCQLAPMSYREDYYLRIGDILFSSSTNDLPAAGTGAAPSRTICVASISFP